jgi:hypothetical protein
MPHSRHNSNHSSESGPDDQVQSAPACHFVHSSTHAMCAVQRATHCKRNPTIIHTHLNPKELNMEMICRKSTPRAKTEKFTPFSFNSQMVPPNATACQRRQCHKQQVNASEHKPRTHMGRASPGAWIARKSANRAEWARCGLYRARVTRQ